MTNPITEEYFNWAMSLKNNEWNLVWIATLPPNEDNPSHQMYGILYVTGNLESVMGTLSALVEGAKQLGPNMLPIRITMHPRYTQYSYNCVMYRLTLNGR